MENTPEQKQHVAANAAGRVFGILSGIGGFVHGVGETLQGNVKTGGLWINSWAQGPIYKYMGGEPGITIVPNFLITGILTMLTALMLIICSAGLAKKRNWGWIIIIVSVAMLLVGGGIGPPVIGILAGACALGKKVGIKKKPAAVFRRLLASIWPFIFGIAALVVAFLVVGSFILVYLAAFNNPDIFTNCFYISVLLLILLNFAGRAYDEKRKGMHDDV